MKGKLPGQQTMHDTGRKGHFGNKSEILASGAPPALPPLLRTASKMQQEEFHSSTGLKKKKTKKEEVIDKKIERLLELYKRQDNEREKKVDQIEY
jgi:hypothetical protein